MTADGRKLELRIIGEPRGNEVSTSLVCWRPPLRVPMQPMPAHEENEVITPPPRLMGVVWMEVADENELHASRAPPVFPGALHRQQGMRRLKGYGAVLG
ncbi:hypothetical protein B0H13DRAFT_2314276 [Mycena leptocephala]|nr:hypothetical protein B0H13DRAFT_2314276 [Mycena leptocephala]